MQRKISVIPYATITRIMLNSGAKRVSKNAARVLSELIYNSGIEIGQRAIELSKHSKRKTVTAADIKFAAKNN